MCVHIYIRIIHRNRVEHKAKVLIFPPALHPPPNPILLFSMPRNDRTAQSFILMIPGSKVLTFPVTNPAICNSYS